MNGDTHRVYGSDVRVLTTSRCTLCGLMEAVQAFLKEKAYCENKRFSVSNEKSE